MYSRVLTKLILDLSVLRTCRTISEECLKILHGNNIYVHLSNQSLFYYNSREWLFLNNTLHTDLDMSLLNPATTIPFLRNIRHLGFGTGSDFPFMLSTMYCIREGICNLKTLGLQLTNPWTEPDIKSLLQSLKPIRVSDSITISAYGFDVQPGRTIFEIMNEALISWDAAGPYTSQTRELQSKFHHEGSSFEDDLLEVRHWVLTVRK